jgi:glycosyltransferase involved in cell wall biosynthesis
VDYLGWQSRREAVKLLGRVRVGLVVLHPTPAFLESYPVKLFEYMAAGLPVIASDFPLWREIVSKAEAGILVDPRNPAAIAGAIDHLLRHPDDAARMGANGRRAVLQRYNWSQEASKLVDLSRKIVGGRG